MEQPGEIPGYLHKTTQGLGIASLVLLTPFAINNFLQERYLLGVGGIVVVAILAFNAWSITYRGRYYTLLTLLVLTPTLLFFLTLAIIKQGTIGVLWCYPAVISFYFMLPERQAWVANAVLGLAVMPVAWNTVDHDLGIRMLATVLTVSIFAAIFVRVISTQQDRLQQQAVTDPLTGVLNRSLMEVFLEHAVHQNARDGTPMTLAALDLDHFKTINDTLGHDAGDRTLRAFARLLQGSCRSTDRVFRTGGEEFLVLFENTDAGDAVDIAEALRRAVETDPLVPEHKVTVSIGLATLRPTEGCRSWMKRSDENLYRAKLEGRNRVAA
jgi:diguanylate cyclase (GGDEF)-like protein